ncbi:hypothetical protein L2E82_01774 [Cichorium intybus]|uniref:Uncharacterized protein n=1 Tax=Cichorium intybus TaxID=13427 RepID=A0ACB9H1D0_CICIN|nr:hypothetical protein L2E82_01774 [Cichorium intybus]
MPVESIFSSSWPTLDQTWPLRHQRGLIILDRFISNEFGPTINLLLTLENLSKNGILFLWARGEREKASGLRVKVDPKSMLVLVSPGSHRASSSPLIPPITFLQDWDGWYHRSTSFSVLPLFPYPQPPKATLFLVWYQPFFSIPLLAFPISHYRFTIFSLASPFELLSAARSFIFVSSLLTILIDIPQHLRMRERIN